MKKSILLMLKLVALALNEGHMPAVTGDENWEVIYDVAKRHGIVNIIAYALADLKYPVSEGIKIKFERGLIEQVYVSEKKNYEAKRLMTAFEEKRISYMPIKGYILQKMYPSSDMRTMADVDILIRQEEFEKVSAVMDGLGYTFTGESDHEYNYVKEPFIRIELHKRLIPSYNQDMYAYFGDGWRLAKNLEENEYKYELSKEDTYIYILSHFAKHYRDGGIGIRHVIDIWLFYKKYDIDEKYIEQKLKELNLYEFYKKVIHLSRVWFEGKEPDIVIENMTMYILNSGKFGTIKNSMSAQAIRENKRVENAARFKYIKFIFPRMSKMKKIFPVLERLPMLLPIMWIWRILRLVIFKRDKIKGHKNMVKAVDQKYINEYDMHMKMVGLDIYNGRRKS